VFKLHLLLVRILNNLPQVQSTFAKKQFEFVVFVSYILQFYYILYVIYSQCYKIFVLYFINCMNAGALLQCADAGGIAHMTRNISLDLRIFFFSI